ncbi:CAF17-like 4Fe-4S cluster assembly/insertion protein YgfZ [Kaarinaea lacus]
MTTDSPWLNFLKQQNAQIENDIVSHFGNKNAERQATVTDTILCDLTHLGFISATGDEAQSFLQNQLSNDIKAVSEQRSQLNAYCTAKGRALAMFRVFQFQDSYFLQLPVEQIEATLKRLKMFVLMTKVTIQDATDQMIAFGLAGADATQLLQQFATDLPQQDDQCVTNEKLVISKIGGAKPRYIVAGNYDHVTEAWDQLKAQTTICGNHAWSFLDIQAGIPQIYANNAEEFVPQMLNLHSIDGISFQKGCYPGQEVVARMHFLGKLKRRMYLAHVDTEQVPQPGDLIFAEDSKVDQAIGRVVQSQPAPDGGIELQAVLQIAVADNKPVHLNSADGPGLTFKELPYSVALERDDT